MKIYTEVIFNWDDKQGKLVETSSESFDYQGEMALCKEPSVLTMYDSAGNAWKIVGTYSTWSATIGEVSSVQYFKNGVAYTDEDSSPEGDNAWSNQVTNFKSYVGGEIGDYKNTKLYTVEEWERGDVKAQWEDAFPGELWDEDMGTAEREKYQKGYIKPTDPDAPTMLHADYLELPEDEKNKWQMNLETGKYDKVKEEYWTTEQQKDIKVVAAERQLQGIIDEWVKITDPTKLDEFETQLRKASEGLELAETPIAREYSDFFGEEGALATIGETYGTGKTRVEEEYLTDVGSLTGEAVYDEEGNLISEGTYTAGMRILGEEKEEAEEDVFLGREEELKALREEAGGEVRAAEAKIGAAGFAATGVGRTAREVLAEEIGGAAQDIEAGFTADREDITEGYITDIGVLEAGKTKSLAEYERTKTTALEDYLSTAEAAAKTGDQPWETATTTYQDLLTGYGTYDPDKGATSGLLLDIQQDAEERLQELQLELEGALWTARQAPGMETWNPFVSTGKFYEEAKEMGWGGTAAGFDPMAAVGLFGETIGQKLYQPVTAGLEDMLYTPEYALPWGDTEETIPQ